MNTALADRVSSAFCGIAQWAGVWTLVGLGLGFGSDTVATPLADANQAHAQAMTRYYNALQALGPNPPAASVQKLQTDILAPAQGERLNALQQARAQQVDSIKQHALETLAHQDPQFQMPTPTSSTSHLPTPPAKSLRSSPADDPVVIDGRQFPKELVFPGNPKKKKALRSAPRARRTSLPR